MHNVHKHTNKCVDTCTLGFPIVPLLLVLYHFSNSSHWFCTHFPKGDLLPNRGPFLSSLIGPRFESVDLPTHKLHICLRVLINDFSLQFVLPLFGTSQLISDITTVWSKLWRDINRCAYIYTTDGTTLFDTLIKLRCFASTCLRMTSWLTSSRSEITHHGDRWQETG